MSHPGGGPGDGEAGPVVHVAICCLPVGPIAKAGLRGRPSVRWHLAIDGVGRQGLEPCPPD